MAKRDDYKLKKTIIYNDRQPQYTKEHFMENNNLTDLESINNLDKLIDEVKIKVFIDLKINYLGGKFYCSECKLYFDNMNTYSPHMIEHLL